MRRFAAVLTGAVAVAVTLAACAQSGGGTAPSASTQTNGGASPPIADAGTSGPNVVDAGSSCVPRTCEQAAVSCGEVSDGCGGTLACGQCAAGQQCGKAGACEAIPPSCTPKTCSELSATCGAVDNGCGGTLSCGSCGANESCVQNACKAATPAGGTFQWTMTVNGTVSAVTVDAAGNAYTAGVNQQLQLVLRKVDAEGHMLFERAYPEAGNHILIGGDALAVSALGNIFLHYTTACPDDAASTFCVSASWGGGSFGAGVLVKLGPDGTFAWAKPTGEQALSLVVDSNGSAIALSRSSPGTM
ncbi:MAG: hypothetical protein ACJ790_08925, partial [Myxococcaceae bacterium]